MSTSKPSGDTRASALLLCPEAPYPLAGGGPLRTASMLEYLACRYELDLVLFRQPGAPDPGGLIPSGRARNVLVIDLPANRRDPLSRLLRNAQRFLRGAPPLNDRFAGFGEPLARFLAGRAYSVAVIEHFWCAPYLEQLQPHARRVVLNLHNLESALYRSCAAAERWPAAWLHRGFADASERLERAWLPRFTNVLAPSDADAARVGAVAPDAAVAVYPNTIPEVALPQVAERETIVFSGNLEYAPNVSAVCYFRREIWPRLRRRRPNLVWRLVGRNPGTVRRHVAGDPRIELVGPVADAVQELASAQVAVVPLLAGSGTRLKILEAWAAGRAVVSTPLGAEGLPVRHGENVLLVNSAADFADAVGTLLDSPSDRARIGAAGRRLYEAGFTWPRAWDALVNLGL